MRLGWPNRLRASILARVTLCEARTHRAADVLIVLPSDDVTADALRLASELRAAGVGVDVFPHAAKLPAQYEVAERKRIPYAIVADAEKLRADALEVRDLAARKNTAMPRGEVAAWLLARR